MKKYILLVTILAIISGCATSIPSTSSVNDFLLMSTKTNSTTEVYVSYISMILDGQIKPFKKGKSGSTAYTYSHNMSSSLGNMVNEWSMMKFAKQSPTAVTTIEIIIFDFWLEQFSPESGGEQFAKAMLGIQSNQQCVAKIKGRVIINHDGKTEEKIISATAEEVITYSDAAKAHGRNINSVSNKVLMAVNSFLETNNL